MLISQQAPDFKTSVVLANGQVDDAFSLYNTVQDCYTVIFFYPFDFTFVCPSELIAIDRRIEAFRQRQVEVIAVSIDSKHTHRAWRDTPINKGGIGPVKYMMAQDVDHQICQSYGVEHPIEKTATRATFILDKQKIVRAEILHDLPLGRNIDEVLRVVDALQFHEKHGEVCPAGWQQGQTAMQESPAGVKKYLTEKSEEL